ncbi:hypothetical protein V5O48_002826 [Marasmius crinis-equi]|uniref:BTB domain-containing protein n=1 Tax=Marasmius crinis-equi TaxID=585013 RepID=A0ABR3FUP4_9AGAR
MDDQAEPDLPHSQAAAEESDLFADEAEAIPASPRPVIRHPHYYIDEKMSIFVVDNQLFRIHRHFLRRESAVFDGMFDCPEPVEGQEGETDDRPIELPGVTYNEFVALLDHFYKGSFYKNNANDVTSLQGYIDLLSIASRYECTEARQKAIKGIDFYQPDPIRRIVLSDQYDVPEWLMPAYIQLCKRDEPLTRDEALEIGPDKTVLIAGARENIRCSPESRRIIRDGSFNNPFGGPFGSNSMGSSPFPNSILEDARVKRFIEEELRLSSLSSPRASTPSNKWISKKKKKKGK